MKKTVTLVLSVALVAVTGLFSSAIFGLIDMKPDAQTSATVSGLITGHVITTHRDAADNILSYRQSDNLIVNQGENCVSKMLFANHTFDSTATGVCTGQNRDTYRNISIGNGSGAVHSDEFKLQNPHNTTSYGTSVAHSGDTMSRQIATTSWTNSNSTGNSSTSVADVVLSAVFKNKNAAQTITVSESGLFNFTSAVANPVGNADEISTGNQDSMFARQTFSAITMNAGDTLTVQWTMSVGGSTLAGLTP